MSRLTLLTVYFACSLAALALGVGGTAQAYDQYTLDKGATYCGACHGDFRDSYISLSDGADWGKSLMDMHADDILSGDCDVCHGTGGRFPVYTDFVSPGTSLDPISCVGCHGRAGDVFEAPTRGSGAGLRQHHWVADTTVNGISTRICLDCHDDADPSAYTPIAEDILPPYYASPAGSNLDYPDMPSDPCNPAADGFPEDYAGTTSGLDNDGNGLYDEADTIPCPEPGQLAMLLPGIGMLLMFERRRRSSAS